MDYKKGQEEIGNSGPSIEIVNNLGGGRILKNNVLSKKGGAKNRPKRQEGTQGIVSLWWKG